MIASLQLGYLPLAGDRSLGQARQRPALSFAADTSFRDPRCAPQRNFGHSAMNKFMALDNLVP
jgi:hypothetical protein